MESLECTRKGSSSRKRTSTTMWSCRGRNCGSNAASRDSLAAAVLELFDEVVGASSALSARLPALPVTSEGRAWDLLNRLDVPVTMMSSDSRSDKRFRF